MGGKKFSIWSRVTVAVAALAAILTFAWPLFISASAEAQAPILQGLFLLGTPALLALISTELANGRLDGRHLALLAALISVNSVIRLLGAGISGIETVFFLIIIGASIFRASFGFLLGAGSLLASALIGAGFGPWLPFQMLAAGLVGLGAGLLPRSRSRVIWLSTLVAYGVLASFVYGALMTMWTWPFLAGQSSAISYRAGAPIAENLSRFFSYELMTGGLVWDLGRALTTSALLLLSAPVLAATLDRAAAKAGLVRH